MKALLKEGLEPARSYFADNDLIAIGAVRAFQEAGYDIPKDISIAGFDNLPIGNYIKPSLSTVNVPKKAMASLAVTRLKEIMGRLMFMIVRSDSRSQSLMIRNCLMRIKKDLTISKYWQGESTDLQEIRISCQSVSIL